jgi:hypothetical protein
MDVFPATAPMIQPSTRHHDEHAREYGTYEWQRDKDVQECGIALSYLRFASFRSLAHPAHADMFFTTCQPTKPPGSFPIPTHVHTLHAPIHCPLMHKLDNAMQTNDHAKQTHETTTQTSHATQRTRETETRSNTSDAAACVDVFRGRKPALSVFSSSQLAFTFRLQALQ